MTKQQLESSSNSPKNQIKAAQQAIAVTTTFQGPLPHPEILAQYETVCPGAADRILSMAENQAKHRQELETRESKANSRDSLLGVICALIIGMTALIGGVLTAINGQPWAGGFFGAAGLGGLVGVFIYGTRNQNKN